MTTLGEVATLNVGRTPPRKDARYWTSELDRPFCTITDMDALSVAPRREGVTELAEKEGKAKRIPAGSLLMSFKLTIGRVGFAAVDLFPNEAIVAIEPVPELDARFLSLWLGHQDLTAGSGRAVMGNTLNSNSLRAIQVAVLPIEEQRRIVDLMDSVDSLSMATEQETKAAMGAVASVADVLIWGGEEPLVATSALAPPRGLIGGPFGSSLVSADYAPTGIPVIRGANLSGGSRFVRGDFVFVPDGKAQALSRNHALPGDVVFTQRGTLGQVALVPPSPFARYVISQSQMRLRPDTSKVQAEYVYWAYRTGRVLAEIQLRKIATANPHINLGILGEIEIPVPSLDRQSEIVALLDDAQVVAEACASAARRIASLRSALLADLLCGAHEIPESYDELLEAV